MNRKGNPWVSLAALTLLAIILVTVCSGCKPVEASEVTYYNRFEVSHWEMIDSRIIRIIEDTETGVQYLLIGTSQGVGLTVLQPGDTETEEASQ